MEVSGEVGLREVNLLVERYCEDHFQSPGDFEIVSYNVRTLSDSPQGFLGKHFLLEIVITRNSDPRKTTKSLKYFVKKAPTTIESFMQYVDDFGVFKKESSLFRELIPRLLDINSKFGKFSPECYLAEEDMLIFEDLAEDGYRMGSSRDQLLDYSHLLCAVKTLANLHSSSAILEAKSQNRLTDLYPGQLKENSFAGWEVDSPRNQVLLTGVKATQALISIVPKYKDLPELPQILKEYEKKFRRLPEYCQSSKWYRNVLLHGDLWANNLMFKYDEVGRPMDCRFVDFQLSRYGPPVLDVIILLTVATTSAFRKKHMEALMENYYHFVDDFMTDHGMDVDDVVTKLEFKECVSYYKIAGLLFSCHISHETILPSEITSEFLSSSKKFKDFYFGNREEYCKRAFESDSIYRERMIDIITDLVDNNILSENVEYNY